MYCTVAGIVLVKCYRQEEFGYGPTAQKYEVTYNQLLLKNRIRFTLQKIVLVSALISSVQVLERILIDRNLQCTVQSIGIIPSLISPPIVAMPKSVNSGLVIPLQYP